MLFISITTVMQCCPHTCGRCIILARALTNGFQQLAHSAPSVLPAKSVRGKSKLCSKESHPENFLHMGGCFKPNTSRIQALVWLKKKEEEEEERR